MSPLTRHPLVAAKDGAQAQAGEGKDDRHAAQRRQLADLRDVRPRLHTGQAAGRARRGDCTRGQLRRRRRPLPLAGSPSGCCGWVRAGRNPGGPRQTTGYCAGLGPGTGRGASACAHLGGAATARGGAGVGLLYVHSSHHSSRGAAAHRLAHLHRRGGEARAPLRHCYAVPHSSACSVCGRGALSSTVAA